MLNENEALIILNQLPKLNYQKIQTLLMKYGNALDILKKNDAEVIDWEKNENWKKDLKLIEQKNISLVSFRDKKYPSSLFSYPSKPLILYVKGELKEEDNKAIAVIGTRTASIYGREMAFSLANSLGSSGFTIISGLARGIDTAAHAGALKNGRTLAVLGSGLDSIYPKENLHLAEKIITNGALISEFPMLTPPLKHHFPKRNRIVSALGLGVVLIESPLKGGAMITMDFAFQQRKKCFALPGRVDLGSFAGNHYLIKNQRASLIENAEDIVHNLGFPIIEKSKAGFTKELENDEIKKIFTLLREEKSIEELVLLTQLPVMKLNILLNSLVLKKVIKEFPGKVYKIA